MRRAIALAMLVGLSCSSGVHDYARNDLSLVTAYVAKELCSCLFVEERDFDYCNAWTQQSPAVTKVHVDFDAQRVETTALLDWGASAHFDSDHFGCVLDPQ